ncbi:pimeloyl-ACP methyl ester carboxylesterase [Mycobacterium sp. MAA66]|uniref:alpha/beta fold hydrolase n=1 Tax=Mycobacterium sp. MAA66 TaxID=3156297 RepID=UPI0035138CCC
MKVVVAVTQWSSTPPQPRFTTVDGITIRYARSDKANETQALLFSPWPESLLAYQQMWLPLAGDAELVAVDLPGFGRSERREHLLSPSAMGEFIVTVADAFDMRCPHLVAPSIGTLASLFTAARHPGRIASLTIGPGPLCAPLEVGEELRTWVRPDSVVDERLLDSPRVLQAFFEHELRCSLPDDVRADYLRSYDGNRFIESLAYLRNCSTQLPAFEEMLSQILTPVQIIAGRYDRLVPWGNAEFLSCHLRTCRLVSVDAGHFVWEEQSREYADLVRSWWHTTSPKLGVQNCPR